MGKPDAQIQCKERAPLFVVDCGSGHSSAMLYTQSSEESVVEMPMKFKDEFPVLVDALKPSGIGAEAFRDALAARLPSDKPVIIAATAGVRQALAQGIINESDIDRLHAALASNPGAKMTFKVLSPLEEAKAEHKALVACCRWSNITTVDGSEISMFSGGGKSMQVAFRRTEEQSGLLSLNLDSFIGTSLAKKGGTGLSEWIGKVQAMLHEQVQRELEISGHFVMIEMLAGVLRAAGVPCDTWFSRDDLIGHLTQHIDTVQHLPASTNDIGPFIVLAYSTQTRCVLKALFHPSAQFYLPQEWEPVTPEFSLGLYLSS